MVYSTVHELEISAINDAWERMELLEILHHNSVKCTGDLQTLRKRANGLAERGMGVADAAHIAFSEISADYFISCDDRLIKQCHRQVVDVTAMTPVEFCLQENLK
jgi:predicted nucleic acid-binding protein